MAKFAGNNPANDPDSKPVKGRSKFMPNRSFYQTALFGLNSPHFAFETVEGDKLSVRVGSDVDTYSLKAPLMTPVKMQKDYFFVPFRSVLPNCSEKIITNPLTGDDVIPQDVNTVIELPALMANIGGVCFAVNDDLALAASASSLLDADAYLLRALFHSIARLEPFASYGSLLTHLGHSNGSFVQSAYQKNGKLLFLDEFIEALIDRLEEDIDFFQVQLSDLNGNAAELLTVQGSIDDDPQYIGVISWRRFFEELRQGRAVYDITGITLKSTADTTRRSLTRIDSDGSVKTGSQAWYLSANYTGVSGRYLNFGRAAAYQIACATFYSEDSVDYVYSAQLWHENQRSLYQYARGAIPANYTLNGIECPYDEISGSPFLNVIQSLLSGLASGSAYPVGVGGAISVCSSGYYAGVTGYVYNLFGFTRSLKFRDYFCGSKTRPMAVGNVNVAVSGGQFSVVDVTKNIQLQRFLNQVNRVGRKFSEYVAGIFGTTPMHDPCEPIFLGMTRDLIGAEETENTGVDQLTKPQTTTSKLRKSSSQFAFEGSFNEPGFVIGITHFDIVRPYVDVTDRCMFHLDRFDMFNPFMQTIGDQEVFGDEIVPGQQTNFGYQLRYSEYKQNVDRCAGAFARFLPGYAFLNRRSNLAPIAGTDIVISPDFIRSRPCEFDRFYVSLTHNSLAGYFHFIIRHDINVDASRAMDAAPSIL